MLPYHLALFDPQDAVSLALRCLNRAHLKGASRKAASRIAANVLNKAAIEKGSNDNVTVLIVDLRSDERVGSGSVVDPGVSTVPVMALAECSDRCDTVQNHDENVPHVSQAVPPRL